MQALRADAPCLLIWFAVCASAPGVCQDVALLQHLWLKFAPAHSLRPVQVRGKRGGEAIVVPFWRCLSSPLPALLLFGLTTQVNHSYGFQTQNSSQGASRWCWSQVEALVRARPNSGGYDRLPCTKFGGIAEPRDFIGGNQCPGAGSGSTASRRR